MQRFGATNRTLLAAGFIFGCSHLNNGPQSLPNWRYMILATLAGVVFGRVFQKSTSILSSVSLHAAVDTAKYAFF
jgi:membrane protease YdiL (CAAX protease family)